MRKEPLVIELTGPPGSGKTTFARYIKKSGDKDIDIYISPYIRDPKKILFFFRNMLLLLPLLVELLKKRYALPSKQEFLLMMILTGWTRVLNKKKNAKLIVLEEGGICLLAKLIRIKPEITQNPILKKWWDMVLENWIKTIGLVVDLDAPSVVLLRRIQRRSVQFEFRNMPDCNAKKYLETIKQSQTGVLSELDIPILVFNTTTISPDNMKKSLFSYLGNMHANL